MLVTGEQFSLSAFDWGRGVKWGGMALVCQDL